MKATLSFPRISALDCKRIQEACQATKYHINSDHVSCQRSTPTSVNTLSVCCSHVDLFELPQLLHFSTLKVKCHVCQTIVCLQSLAEVVLHKNHSPRTGEALPTTSVNPCPDPKCADISFPHDIVMMIHELPSLENEDPCLTEMFSKMCSPGT